MKIICIDDNQDITDLCKTVLSSDGNNCLTTDNGQDGVNMIKSEKPDLVLLDLAMPKFSGEDVVNELLKDGPIEGYNIYLFTASAITEKSIGELLKLGVKGYLKKPLRVDTLMRILQKHRLEYY